MEDNLKVFSILLDKLYQLQSDQPYELSVIVLTNSQQVEDYLNSNPKANFDIALLDRDCKLGRSFHILDIEKFGADKIISISSIPEFNQEVEERGVKSSVLKDYSNLEGFTDKVVEVITQKIKDLPD